MMELYRHQQMTIDLMLSHQRAAIFNEMGTGKTLCAIEAIKRQGLKKALIVAPKYLLRTWYDEVRKWHPEIFPRIIEAKGRREALESDAHFKIINYDGFRIERDTIKKIKPDIIVFDESQYVKSRSSQVTKAAWDISKSLPSTKIYCMTGTPLCNDFSDFYAQYRLLRPDLFKTWTEFKSNYLIMGGYLSYKIIGHRNEEQFRKLTDEYTIRIKKKDCVNLPEKIYQTIYVDLPDDLKAIYLKMAKEAVMELENSEIITADMVVTRLMRLQQLCNGWIGYYENEDKTKPRIKTVCESPKLKVLMGIVEENLNDHSMLIWGHFRHDIQNIVNALTERKIKASFISGSVSVEERQRHINDFQAKKIQVLVIQDSITAGMTLTAADLVLFYQNSYSYSNRLQAEDRCHRIGQKNNVTYIDIIAEKTVEEKIKGAIEAKQNIASIVDKNGLREIFLGGKN